MKHIIDVSPLPHAFADERLRAQPTLITELGSYFAPVETKQTDFRPSAPTATPDSRLSDPTNCRFAAAGVQRGELLTMSSRADVVRWHG